MIRQVLHGAVQYFWMPLSELPFNMSTELSDSICGPSTIIHLGDTICSVICFQFLIVYIENDKQTCEINLLVKKFFQSIWEGFQKDPKPWAPFLFYQTLPYIVQMTALGDGDASTLFLLDQPSLCAVLPELSFCSAFPKEGSVGAWSWAEPLKWWLQFRHSGSSHGYSSYHLHRCIPGSGHGQSSSTTGDEMKWIFIHSQRTFHPKSSSTAFHSFWWTAHYFILPGNYSIEYFIASR